jgi:hypothetical protein
MTTIISKSGTGVPLPDKLETAELAVDTSNGNLYTKLSDNSVVQINDGSGSGGGVEEAPIDTKQYARQDGSWSEIVIPDGGTGSSVHIGDTPPANPQEGQQWMEVPADGDATMWIYDGANWLQQPGGKDGADGTNGVDGLWTDNGGNSISYDGNVGINANSETPLTIGKAGTTALWEWDLQAGAVDSIRLSAKNPSGGYYAQDALVVDSGGTVTVNGDLLAAKAGAGDYAVGVGYRAGMNDQSVSAVAVGVWAGESNQGAEAVAVGKKAGQTSQGDYATALGDGAGKTDQGAYSTAVGVNAGETSQSVGAVGVGDQAGRTNQGQYSVAIGRYAGRSNQAANGIIISSNASAVDSSSVGHIIIKSTTQDLRSMHGGGFAMNGDPIIGTRKLISTLSTLRNATKDETTLEGMRDALADAIGGLIEGLEHEIATQEIAE